MGNQVHVGRYGPMIFLLAVAALLSYFVGMSKELTVLLICGILCELVFWYYLFSSQRGQKNDS